MVDFQISVQIFKYSNIYIFFYNVRTVPTVTALSFAVFVDQIQIGVFKGRIMN